MIMMLQLLLIMLSIGEFWNISFQAHPENVGVIVVTKCGGKEPISGYNWVDISPTDTSARVRKIWTPEGATCFYIAQVMRSSPGSGPNQEYVGESGTQ